MKPFYISKTKSQCVIDIGDKKYRIQGQTTMTQILQILEILQKEDNNNALPLSR